MAYTEVPSIPLYINLRSPRTFLMGLVGGLYAILSF